MNRIVVWAFCVPLALLLFAFLVVGVFVTQSKRGLEDYKADLERRGEPLTLEQLRPKSSETEPNKTIALIEAAEHLNHTLKSKGILLVLSPGISSNTSSKGLREVGIWRDKPRTTYSHSEPTWEEAAAGFQPAEEKIDVLRQISRRPDSDSSWSFGDFDNFYVTLMIAAEGLRSDAILRMREGNFTMAVDDIEAIIEIVRIATAEPLIDSLVLRLNALSIADSCTWELLQTRKAASNDLTRLQNAWNSLGEHPMVSFALRTERASILESPEVRVRMSLGLDGVHPQAATAEPAFFVWENLSRHGEERRFAESMQTLIDAAVVAEAGGDWEKYFSVSDAIEAGAPASLVNLLNDCLDSARFVTLRAVYLQMRINLTRCAIALSRYEIDHGRFPDSLDQLVPQYLDAIPPDPYGKGAPPCYRLTAPHDFILYSIGGNFTDDGGDPSPPTGGRPNESKDFLWEKPAPIKKPK